MPIMAMRSVILVCLVFIEGDWGSNYNFKRVWIL